MIKVYESGASFYEENKCFLLQDPYSEVFFRLDSKTLMETNKNEYAIKLFDNKHILVALLKEPYPILVMGDVELVDNLVDYLISNKYRLYDYFCRADVGDALLDSFKSMNIDYVNNIRMDFMECKQSFASSSSIVEIPNENDTNEIYEMSCAFVIDCGLHDVVDVEKIRESITFYRIIRESGKIASMAKIVESTKFDKKITDVYTRPEYRGKKYAKTIVTNIVNEVLMKGYYATLNVDQKNPVSYHIYTSIGFNKIFTQAIYYLK